MKVITICQPYAMLFFLPKDHPLRKRVENRTWGTPYRGPLVIHAGKSRKYLTPEDEAMFPDMAFGALIGVVEMIDDVTLIGGASGTVPDAAAKKHPWMRNHVHTEGPHCFVMDDTARRFETPIPYRGQLDIWNIDAGKAGVELYAEIERAIASAVAV